MRVFNYETIKVSFRATSTLINGRRYTMCVLFNKRDSEVVDCDKGIQKCVKNHCSYF